MGTADGDRRVTQCRVMGFGDATREGDLARDTAKKRELRLDPARLLAGSEVRRALSPSVVRTARMRRKIQEAIRASTA